jgi:hypothetical protein
VWTIVLASCSARETIEIDLPIAPAHRSLILAVENDGDLSVSAFDLDEQRPIVAELLPSYIGSYPVRLTAFLYAEAIEDIALSPGPISPAKEGRPIPEGAPTLTAILVGSRFEPWAEAVPRSDAVDRFRLDSLSIDACLQRGGCFGGSGDGCLLPCPSPPPTPAAAFPSIGAPECPAGWTPIQLTEGPSACAPWTATPACTGYATVFPGETECRLVQPCPAGPWPDPIPSGARVYVLAAAAPGGTGTEGAPFQTIQDAVNAAQAGSVIVVGEGVYGDVQIDRSVTIAGLCPERTEIRAGAIDAVRVRAPVVAIEGVSITGERDGIDVGAAGSVAIRRTHVRNAGGSAIRNGGAAVLEEVVLTDSGSFGLDVHAGTLEGDRVHISGSGGGAILVSGASLSLSRAVVRDTREEAAGNFGRGANVQNNATARFVETVFERHHDIGVFVSTASATLDRVVIRETESRSMDDGAGFGLLVQNRGSAIVSRAWLDGNRESNVYVLSDGEVTISDAVLSGARLSPNDAGGYGLQILGGSRAELSRIAVVGSAVRGINWSDSSITAADILVDGVGAHPTTRAAGKGITISGTSDVTARRIRVEDTAGRGIEIKDATVTASISDVVTSRTGLTDCFICSGICIEAQAVVEAHRIGVEAAVGGGLMASDARTQLVADGVTITGSKEAEACTANNPLEAGHGVGLRIAEGAIARVSGFTIRGCAESGVFVTELITVETDTAADLFDGLVTENGVGASLLIRGYDARRLANRVRYIGNGSNLIYE